MQNKKIDNVLIFPAIKVSRKAEINSETVSEKDIETICSHYTNQIIIALGKRHKFPMDGEFLKDSMFFRDSLKSAIMRSVGKYHPLQEIIDELAELDDIEDSFEVTEDTETVDTD